MGFVFFFGAARGDAVPSFRPFTWLARDLSACFCGVVRVGCCPTVSDEELRGVEVTGAGSGAGFGTGVGVEVFASGAEVFANGSGSGVGA